jgi:4-amino-4-deoxy-L-arabinose transferase-like glycosyltransferase
VSEPPGRWVSLALLAAALGGTLAWLDARYGWITPAFDAVAHLFYEVPILAAIRRPSQLVLVRWHLALGSILIVLGLMAAPWLSRHGRRWLAIFGVGFAIRAVIWICGGNLPLIPGDSCHYLEVSTSVLRGKGPVQHYVGSFFIDYPRIRDGQGLLSDWDTPLDAYVRAAAYRLAGLGPDASLESRIIVAKACSFILNILALPVIYGFARRRYGAVIGLWSMAALAVLPVHAIYAGFILRESLVALLAILAVWTLTEILHAAPRRAALWAWTVSAGLCGGLAAMARMTGLALLSGAGLFALITSGRQRWGALLVWGAVAAAVCAPWAWVTLQEYGAPFYSCTKYFEYNFSWTVHHFDKGNTLPSQFYTRRNLPEIVRVKVKSLFLIPVFSTMILGFPIVLGFCRRLLTRGAPGRQTDLMVATIYVVFVLATLKSIADVTQVAQLGRYYMPVFALMLPGAVAGLADWLASLSGGARLAPWLAALSCALVWADPTWAYDASWLAKPFQLHWPALREVGQWVQEHPERVPPQARIMTWFPWELRVTTDRTTILLPRNYSPRRIQEVIRQYQVTHFLWGSFEPPPYYEINPQGWGLELEQLRQAIGLTDSRELYRSSHDIFFPVRLYRLPQAYD